MNNEVNKNRDETKRRDRIIRAQIRKASAVDVPVIKTCAQNAFAVYIERIGREPAPMVADFAAQVSNGIVFVLGDEAEIFGYVAFYPRNDHIYIENLAVHPQYQGCGIGRQLLAFVEDRARRSGFAAVELCTNQKMYENLKLYPALGYIETGGGTEDGYDRVFFRKTI